MSASAYLLIFLLLAAPDQKAGVEEPRSYCGSGYVLFLNNGERAERANMTGIHGSEVVWVLAEGKVQVSESDILARISGRKKRVSKVNGVDVFLQNRKGRVIYWMKRRNAGFSARLKSEKFVGTSADYAILRRFRIKSNESWDCRDPGESM